MHFVRYASHIPPPSEPRPGWPGPRFCESFIQSSSPSARWAFKPMNLFSISHLGSSASFTALALPLPLHLWGARGGAGSSCSVSCPLLPKNHWLDPNWGRDRVFLPRGPSGRPPPSKTPPTSGSPGGSSSRAPSAPSREGEPGEEPCTAADGLPMQSVARVTDGRKRGGRLEPRGKEARLDCRSRPSEGSTVVQKEESLHSHKQWRL